MLVKLKNRKGKVFEMDLMENWREHAYSPDEDGFQMMNVGGFGYDFFIEANKDDKVTHKHANHVSLEFRGDAIPVDQEEYEGYKQ